MSALARVAERRFPSFSEAADAVLDLLEAEQPGDSVLLGQVDWEEHLFRVIDARGEAAGELAHGSTVPLAARPTPGENGSSGGLLDPEELGRLGICSYLAAPLETSAGIDAITLCACSATKGAFDRNHLEPLIIAGRLLAYEWESVNRRADLRRLTQRLRDPEHTDDLTALPNRASFLVALDREWQLAHRGSSESYLLVCRLANLERVRERHGAALADLLLKDSAQVLDATIRRSDHPGRVGADLLGVVLVGCKGLAGAEAFVRRFEQALAQETRERPAAPQVTHSVQALERCSSPAQALELAQAEAREAPASVAGDEAIEG